MSTPFYKMKGHTLPGINQRKSNKQEDGKASSSAFQFKSHGGFVQSTMGKRVGVPSIRESTVNPIGKSLNLGWKNIKRFGLKKVRSFFKHTDGEHKDEWVKKNEKLLAEQKLKNVDIKNMLAQAKVSGSKKVLG